MENSEWLKWRHKRVGGSDAPIVMGVSKYMTPLELYEQKILPEPPEQERNFIQERGQRFEPKIRELFNLTHWKTMEPALLESADFTFMGVSLDGRDGKEICEIKMASKEDHEGVIQGRCPAHYYPQVQHELAVSGADYCWYISYWDPDQDENNVRSVHMAVLKVHPDPVYIGDMIQKEQAFWDCVQKRKPPQAEVGDYKTLKGLAPVANKYKRLKLKLEELETQIEACKDELIAAAKEAKHPRLRVGNLRLNEISRVGNVDYKKVPELKGVDLDKYRGKGSLYWKIDVESQV